MELNRFLVLIRGAGDLASGVAARLHRCGFPVVMTELPQPLMVRRAVCFGEAVYEGQMVVEGIVARRVPDVAAARTALADRSIPILVDSLAACRAELAPRVLVDGVMAKCNTGAARTTRTDAPLVIGLGPGFTAGADCHAVIETQRGHWLGRVYWQGSALPDTGVPGEIGGATTASRILRAPAGGLLAAHAEIGDAVALGQLVATVAGVEVRAGCAGVLRGLIRPGAHVTAGLKIGDIDPRGERDHCFTLSDKSLVAGGTVVEEDKAAGVTPEFVDRLAAHPAVDAVIVEADGSRRRPFKAPAAHEPVIPARATIVVPVVGLDVVGRPLTADAVHRPELVAALSGAALGDPVTPELIATVLAHPAGGAKDVPPAARLIPFLNKADDAAALAAARCIARRLLAHPIVDSVIIGAAEAADPVREVWGRVAVVVLAAGQGRRFGALKQILPWRGVPLVAHVADQALACPDIARVIVTVGAGAEQTRDALGSRCVDVVTVPDWAAGQSRSVQAGLRAAGFVVSAQPNGAVSAVLFLLADQPGVSPDLLSALIERHRATLAPVVAPRYREQRGNPVLFDRVTFGEFARLSGDIGARPIIQAHAAEIAWVDWPTAEITQDIDVAEDFVTKPPPVLE